METYSSYLWLENSMNRGAWQATVHGVAESDMTQQLTDTFLPAGQKCIDISQNMTVTLVLFEKESFPRKFTATEGSSLQ